MKTVLMSSPNALDGVSLYRHWGPMLNLEKDGHVRLVSMPGDSKELSNWTYYKKCEFAFISRPYRNYDYFFIKECQKYGLPIWIDIDDNLFAIPDDNDAYELFSSDDAQKYLIFALKSANHVTVATQKLKDFLWNRLQVQSQVIENALDDFWLTHKRPFQKNKNILWRGSKSHLADLLYYENELLEVISKNLDHDWLFMGMNPFFLRRRFKDAPIRWSRTMNFIDFIHEMIKFGPTFHFISMIDQEFNRTRSCNGWVENTLAGGVTFSPNWDEWEKPGIIHYSSPKNFSERFLQFIHFSEKELKSKHDISWEYIRDNLLLSKINQKRLEIINNL